MAKMFKGINGVALHENRPLTRKELQAVVPSIFATQAHESRSERFAPVATIEVVDRLEKEGYFPFFAVQPKVRKEDKSNFTKHMLRLRRNDGKKEGEANEIILVNANDGTSSYKLMAGQFRFVCANGLVMGDLTRSNRIYHKGQNVMDDVIEGVYEVVNEFAEIDEYKGQMQLMDLTENERKSFAMAGYIIKEGMPDDFNNLKYNPMQLLSRTGLNTQDQYDTTLYSTFNTVQQHLVNGGQSGFTPRGRRTTTRGVTQIDKNIEINSRLWDMAVQLAKKSSTNKSTSVSDYIDADLA